MVSIQLSVFLFTQKFVSTAYGYKDMGGLFILVPIWVILQRQRPKAFLYLSEISRGGTLKQLVRVFAKLQFIQFFFQSLHLLYIIVLQMALNKLYNEVINYFWSQSGTNGNPQPPEADDMSHISRINRLSTILKETNYSEIQKQQICMFYSNLIKEYPQARSSLTFPKFLYQPPLYTPKACFSLTLTTNNSKIYCILQLAIVFNQKLDKEMPDFYLRNPNYSKYKPNKHHVQFASYHSINQYYQAVLGGVKIMMPQVSNQRWAWTSGSYFKEQNIINMVKWVQKQLLLEYFPFSSRKNQQIDSIEPQSKALYSFLNENLYPSAIFQEPKLLKNIQQLSMFLKSMKLETNQIVNSIAQLKRIADESQKIQISQCLPKTKDQESENILTAVASLQALKDTSSFLESKFNQKQLSFDQFLTLSTKTFAQQFDQRAKLSKVKYEVL